MTTSNLGIVDAPRHAEPSFHVYLPIGLVLRTHLLTNHLLWMLRRCSRLVALPVMLAAVTPAAAAAVPSYRSPAGVDVLTKAPAKAPLPLPPAVPLSSSGTFPDALVDEAGTAHIVWNEGRGEDADVAVYCRLKRGASACDGPPVTLAWNKAYGEGDSPAFNVDNEGPKIVRVGEQLVVLSHRYPTVSEKPDGSGPSSQTVVAWSSTDGGRTWSDASIVGRWALGQVGLVGEGDKQRIVNLAQDPLCPGMCAAEFRSGEYSGSASDLATGPDQAYSATLAVTDGLPNGAWGDLSHRIFLRRWTGSGSLVDAGTWSQSPPLAGDEPSLAGGPGGLWLMHRARTQAPGRRAPLVVRPVGRQGDTLLPGTPTTISTTNDNQFGRLAQDAQGNLLAAWQQRNGTDPGVRLRQTERPIPPAAATRATPRAAGDDLVPAGALGAARRLVAGRDNGQIALAAAADGGGFAVLNHTGGVNAAGQILATGFGNLDPTNQLGLGQLPGTGATGKRCDTVDFGSFDIRARGCFFNGLGADARKVSTNGEVDLFGLKIIPDAGSTLVIDPAALQLHVVGQVRVLVRAPVVGDVTLWHGKLDVDLKSARPGSVLFDFPIGDYAANILGFPTAANIQVVLQKDGVHIPMSLKLPPAFFGASASTEFVADRASGLRLTSLHLHLGPVPLGAASLDDFDLLYEPGEQLWRGEGAVTVAGFGGIQATASFKRGAFNEATIAFSPNPPVTIGPFVYLLRAGGGFRVDPLHIEIDGRIGGGAAVDGKSPVIVNGKATADFPQGKPGQFAILGDVSLLDFDIAEGRLRYQTDGYADFNVDVHQDFAVLNLIGHFDGFIDAASGDAAARLNGSVCLSFGFPCLAGASLDGSISRRGLSICAGASIGDFGEAFPKLPGGEPILPEGYKAGDSVSAGVQFTLEGLRNASATIAEAGIFAPIVGVGIIVDHLRLPCHSEALQAPGPRIRSRGSAVTRAVSVPAGLPTQTILVRSDEGMPAVDLVNGNARLTGPAPGERGRRQAGGIVLAIPDAHAVAFILEKPQAGTWTVVPRDGSPPVTEIRTADGYRAATPTAAIRTTGRRRTLAFHVADLGSGQSVRFVESGAFGTRVLGTATRPAGTFPLPAGTLRGGHRTITAETVKDGLVTDRKLVARYVAPTPPGPGPVAGLKVIRRGTTLTAIWGRASVGAARQLVRVRGARGTRLLLLLGPTTRTARFAGVRADERVTVEVTGLTPTMGRGRPAQIVSRPPNPRARPLPVRLITPERTSR